MKNEISSGAEKAEKLTRKSTVKSGEKQAPKKAQPVRQKSAENKTASRTTAAKKQSAVKQVESKKAKKQDLREQKKLEAAKLRAEKKQKKLEKKLEHKQKRLDRIAAYKEKMAERKEKRRERRDLLRQETKEARLERKKEELAAKIEARVAKREARAAERRAKREHDLKVRAEKRANRKEREHAPGFGGWLAAVISLGVTTLALGTMLTFGWLNMNGMQADMAGVYTQSLYELNSVVDNLDSNLAKARVAGSQQDRVRLLSDIAIQSEMAEIILERMPVETQLTQNMTSFVNKMGDSAQSMLYSVAAGNDLTESQKASIEYMYDMNLQMKRVINELTSESTEKAMLAAIRGKSDSLMHTSFGELENNTIETPKEINDGPFSENIKKVTAKNLENLEDISATKAEELAKEYFRDYKIKDVRCTGEAVAQQLECFNVALMTDDGEMLAQLSKKGGKVVMFDSYKDCADKNFSVERCIDIAQDFLKDLGYEDMKAVWTSENGTTCNLNFVYEQDGVIYYPDMIKVKVCEQRGIVTGMEGLSYVLNHTERQTQSAAIGMDEAREKINSGVEVKTSRLTVIPHSDEEVLAYEFCGTYDGNTYYIYVDALTGDEIEVFTVVGTKQGRALM